MKIEQHDELIAYLKAHGHLDPREEARCEPLLGGVSCMTVLIQRTGGPSFVVKQALKQLKVQQDWFSDPARIHHEAEAMRHLNAITPSGRVPQLLFEDRQFHLLGMEAVPWPHENWKSLLLDGHVDLGHFEQFAVLLATIHRTSFHNDDVRRRFSDRQFFQSLRLEPYYAFTAKQVPRFTCFLHELIAESQSISATLVHGDYSPKNVLIYQDRLVLLDHEVMHFGDGAFDIGFSMTHFLSKARHVPGQCEAFFEAAQYYWDIYRGHFKITPKWEQRAVRHTLACMLARVKGKSPLEYLSGDEQLSQVQLCLDLLPHIPATIRELLGMMKAAPS